MGHKKSTSWLNKQNRDPYVIQARKAGYRSRASFKLLELDKANKLFRPGMCVVDLGAAPGGWSQVLVKQLGKNGKIYSIDLLDMKPIPGVHFIKGDFREAEIQVTLKDMMAESKVDWVISDMAPNLSGVTNVDQSRMIELAESACHFAYQVLSKDGGFLIKLFQGEEVKSFVSTLSEHFKRVTIRKPDASRSDSREIYVLAQGFKVFREHQVLLK